MKLRTAKSCGPDLSTLRSTWRRCERITPGTVTKQPDHRGEHEAAVKTVAQETPGDPAVPVVTMLVCFLFCTRGYGCDRRPAFPAPSTGAMSFAMTRRRLRRART